MKVKSLRILTIALLFVAVGTGCGKQESKQKVILEASKQEVIPEATNTTCTLENQKKFGTDFAGKCMRLGTYTKSTGRQWNFSGEVKEPVPKATNVPSK